MYKNNDRYIYILHQSQLFGTKNKMNRCKDRLIGQLDKIIYIHK